MDNDHMMIDQFCKEYSLKKFNLWSPDTLVQKFKVKNLLAKLLLIY